MPSQFEFNATICKTTVSTCKRYTMILLTKRTLAVVFIMIMLNACTKDKTALEENVSVMGTWRWDRTDGGIGNHIHETPATTGMHVLLELSNDYTYTIKTQGTVTEQGTFTLSEKECHHDKTQKVFITFSGSRGWMIEDINVDKLRLSDEFADGVFIQYSKIIK